MKIILNKIKTQRRYRLLLSCLLILIAFFIATDFQPIGRKKTKKLVIGAFTGSYWDLQNGYAYKILDEAIEEYKKENPEVEVEYVSGITRDDYQEWLAEQMAQGKMPDVFFVPSDDFSNFAQIGAMMNLNTFIKKDKDFHLENFYKKTLQSGSYKNAQYALPYECAPTLMMVNKTLLREKEVKLSGKEWTWGDFYNACEKVGRQLETDTDQYGVINYGWQDAFAANNVKLFNSKGTECDFTSANIYEAILFLERLSKLPQGRVTSAMDFYKGRVAFEPMLFSEYRAYISSEFSAQNYADFDWSYTTMPAGTSGKNISRLDTLNVAMYSETRNPKEAWEFMKVLTASEKIQSKIFDYSEGISPLINVTEDPQIAAHVKESYGVTLDRDVISYAMENAVTDDKFNSYHDAETEVSSAVNSILDAKTNIQMEQIIWNRRINSYLKKIK